MINTLVFVLLQCICGNFIWCRVFIEVECDTTVEGDRRSHIFGVRMTHALKNTPSPSGDTPLGEGNNKEATVGRIY